jgi:hypothetical protein
MIHDSGYQPQLVSFDSHFDRFSAFSSNSRMT